MICPKCKKQIPERTLKCTHCGAKIATFCKKCNTYNPIYNLRCVKCNNELLRICPSCKSANFPNSAKCRKCGYNFAPQTANVQAQKETPKIVRPQEIKIEPQPQNITKQPQQEEIAQTQIQEAPIQNIEPQVQEEPQIQAPSQNIEIQEVKVEQVQAEVQEQPQQPEQEATSEAQPEVAESEEALSDEFQKDLHSQQTAKDMLTKALLAETKVIAVNGKTGVGKTIVLKAAMHDLKKSGITWLWGECSNITQLAPCGLIQDILLTFFNIPNFCTDNLKLKKESQRFFHSEFPSLNNEEIFDLLNFLYPTNSDYYENILNNKLKTFALLQKVFKTIVENNETVIVVENFEFIDGMSYEFLHNMLNSQLIKGQLKFLITYNDFRPGRGYLYNNELKDNAYLDISLGSFDRNQVKSLTNSIIAAYFPDEECPESLLAELFNVSNGIPATLEQYVSLIVDFKAQNNSFQITLPKTFDEAIKMRLKYLKENQIAYNTLSLAAIQGIKFSPVLINQILRLDDNKYLEVLNLLQNLNYIIPVSNNFYEFKNLTLWNSIIEGFKIDDNFIGLNTNLMAVYSEYKLSTHSMLAIVAQNLNQNQNALEFWTDNIKIASYIGDTNLYAISQKQCLALIDIVETPNNNIIRNNIFERLGKLLSQNNPQEAMEYLPNAILNAQKYQDILKEIELTGYLASCCNSVGNYFGTIECIDNTIKKIDDSFELEIAMVKSRKLEALLNIGNCGELVNLIDNEVLPVFDKYINAKPHKNISIKSLYKTWLQTYLVLANALIFQGNNRSFEVIETLFEILQKNNFDDQLFICKAKLALAFANTIKGDIPASEEILGELLKTYQEIMDTEAICRWNLINIINSFQQKKYTGLKEELFQVVTYANNYNDNLTKNILKTLLGKIFKDDENAKRALNIYSEQITYFSKEKIALGALLAWYLIADAKLITDGPERSLEVSMKALEVAQSAKINNYLFIALYNKIIAEAYMVLADYDTAKIHIEKAIMVARKFDLLNILTKLYLLYGKYLQDIAITKTEEQADYASGAAKMYKKASVIARKLRNSYLIELIDKSQTVLNSFCQLNNIVLHDK